MSDILQCIDAQREQYMRLTGNEPKYLYLCQEHAHQLDATQGCIVFTYKGMDVVIVDKRNWLGVGDRYVETEAV